MSGIDKSKLFGGLLTDALQTVAHTAHLKAFRAGEVVFAEGDPGDGLYVVLEGMVLLSARVSDEQRRVFGRVVPGDFFGEMAILDNEPRSASATAERDTKLAFISRENMLQALESSPKLALTLMREFSLRMRDSNAAFVQELLQAERLSMVGRFARTIVHDFKNPLNIIGLSAEMMAMESVGKEMRVSAQKRIRKQVDRLSNMITELLEFTRGSQASITLAAVEFAPYVHQLIDDIKLEVADKRVEIILENEPPEVTVHIDQRRLTHVFYNLINNAVQEMADGGKVIARFNVADNEVWTELEDTGKGIAPEIAGRLFEPFATHGKSQGTGLGLSICKKIVEDHHGRIKARSELGHGAVFLFSIPLKKPAK